MSPWRLIIASFEYCIRYVPEDPNLILDETTARGTSCFCLGLILNTYMVLLPIFVNLKRSLPNVLHWFLKDRKFVSELKNGDEKECAICFLRFNASELQVRFYLNILNAFSVLLNFTNLQMVVLTDCWHCFHAQCIAEWLRVAPNHNCPICRQYTSEGWPLNPNNF